MSENRGETAHPSDSLNGDGPAGDAALAVETTEPPAVEEQDDTLLADLDDREFNRHIAAINAAYDEVRTAYATVADTVAEMLTEQITRHVLKVYPNAATLSVDTVADFHRDEQTGEFDPACKGHSERFAHREIRDADGEVLGELDVLSPVGYWLERLGQVMPILPGDLDLAEREWTLIAPDCLAGDLIAAADADEADPDDEAGEAA